MVMHKALKPFGWYPDGHTREALEIGDERDFGDVANGLVAAKMIAPVGVVESAPVVEVKTVDFFKPDAVELADEDGTDDAAEEDAAEEDQGKPVEQTEEPKRRGRGRK